MNIKWIASLILLIIISFGIFQIQKTKSSLETSSPTNSPTSKTQSNNGGITISMGATPDIPLILSPEFTIHVFANNLGTARDLQFSPGGTLLVSNPAGNQVIALPDADHNGVADSNKVIINSGNNIHGLAFHQDQLFVTEVDQIVRYNWDEQDLQASFDKILFKLPANNNHVNRTITFDNSGNLYVSVGSTCNVCLEKSDFSGTVMISNFNGDNPRIFANGLRNAAFITFNPKTNQLWGTEMGRDYLGDNTPPDEINIISKDKNYGWPFCYGDKIRDTTFEPTNNFGCNNTETPLYQIPAHSAPLGIAFINSSQFSPEAQNDLLVAYHGSWNRSTPTGFKVVHMKIRESKVTDVSDFLTGFLQSEDSLGRPVDLIFDSRGNLYLSDDKAGKVYIIQKNNSL